MKKYLLLTLFPALLFFAACETNKSDSAKIEADLKDLEFEAEDAAPQTVTVTPVDMQWDFVVPEADKLWLSATKESGKLIVTAADNNSKESRTSMITLNSTSSSEKKSTFIIVVTQKASSRTDLQELVLDKEVLTFKSFASLAQDVMVTMEGGDFKWTAVPEEASKSWLHVAVEGNKITVTVEDYTNETKQRIGSIIVAPDSKSINAKTIKVVQEVKPALIIESEGLFYEATDNDDVVKKINVKATNTDWDAKVTYAAGTPENWVKLSVSKGTTPNRIDVRVAPNEENQERTATLVVMALEQGLAPKEIKITQAGLLQEYSTIEGDVEMNIKNAYVYARPNQIWDTDATFSTWDIRLLDGDITYDTYWGKYSGTGGYLNLNRLITEPFAFNEAKIYELTSGVYTVSSPRGPGKIDKGYVGQESRKYGTWYNKLENGVVVAVSRIVEGTVTVSKKGFKTTIVVDLIDDADNKITGTYVAELSIYQEGEPADPNAPDPGDGDDEGGSVRAMQYGR